MTTTESNPDRSMTSETFGDFVQYTNDNESGDAGSKTHPTQTLMQACVSSFQDLFCQLVCTHIIRDKLDLADSLVKQLEKESQKFKLLPNGLRKLVYSEGDRFHCYSGGSLKGHTLAVGDLSKHVSDAFSSACQLLVDFSCFRMCCTENQTSAANGKGKKASFINIFFHQ